MDVQLQDYMKGLGMDPNEELNLNMNRLKALQKLYLFEQKGGENYLGWTSMGSEDLVNLDLGIAWRKYI